MFIKKTGNVQIKIEDWVSFFVVIYPLIFGYKSIFPLVTFGEVIAIITIGYVLAFSKGRIINDKVMICIIAVIVVRIAMSIFQVTDMIDSLGTGLRLIMLYCFIIILKPYFNVIKGKRYLEVVAALVALYGFIQIVAAKFGIYLTPYLPFLNSIRDVNGEILLKAMYGIAFRPTSILGEPGELGGYLALPLALNLFDDKRENGWLKKSIFFSIAIVSTMSSTGIALFIIEWAIFVFKSKNIRNKGLLIVILIIGGGPVFVASGMWRLFIERTFESQGTKGLMGILSNTHFRTITAAYDENVGLFGLIFGNGMSQPSGFLPGVFRLHYYLGIVGIIAFAIWLFKLYEKGTSMQKYLMIVWLVMNLGGAYILGAFALTYTLFLSAETNDCYNKYGMNKPSQIAIPIR